MLWFLLSTAASNDKKGSKTNSNDGGYSDFITGAYGKQSEDRPKDAKLPGSGIISTINHGIGNVLTGGD